jgi:hypothetical protein
MFNGNANASTGTGSNGSSVPPMMSSVPNASTRPSSRMMDRIVQLRRDGLTIKELAVQLTREGYRTPSTQKSYTPTSVRQLLSRRGPTGGAIGREQLESGEWWLPNLAQELGTSCDRLRDWALRGKVRARRVQPGGPWVVWADRKERRRLRKLVSNTE